MCPQPTGDQADTQMLAMSLWGAYDATLALAKTFFPPEHSSVWGDIALGAGIALGVASAATGVGSLVLPEEAGSSASVPLLWATRQRQPVPQPLPWMRRFAQMATTWVVSPRASTHRRPGSGLLGTGSRRRCQCRCIGRLGRSGRFLGERGPLRDDHRHHLRLFAMTVTTGLAADAASAHEPPPTAS